MIFYNSYRVGIEQTGADNEITDRALLSIMEDIASLHSASIGYGPVDLEEKKSGWILLDWQIKVLKRPKYSEKINAATWSRKCDRVCAYRDFEFRNECGEIIVIGTSRWVMLDITTRRPIRITPEIAQLYESEPDRQVFEDEIRNIKCADIIDESELKNISDSFVYRVLRRDIDINQHMHNINYIDIAYETLPEEVYKNVRFKTIRIQYKKELKYNDEAVCYYLKKGEWYFVFICVEDNIHAMVALN